MDRLQAEGKTLEIMIILNCKKQHSKQAPCVDCVKLIDYSLNQLSRCRYGSGKPACVDCTTHCYAPKQRQSIRQIMRSVGPTMGFRHPWLSLRHIFHL